ncbi:transposase [Corynebacterium macginleyi]|nr:transposase [Corynebacterium macginleyi]
MVIESERPIAHVAKEIGVSAGLLGRWVKLERERRGASDGMSEADLRAENARLRRELAEAKMDNEFLSKATAFFAAKQREQKSSN